METGILSKQTIVIFHTGKPWRPRVETAFYLYKGMIYRRSSYGEAKPVMFVMGQNKLWGKNPTLFSCSGLSLTSDD